MIHSTKRAARIGLALGMFLAAGAARATDYQRVAIVGGAAGLHDFTDPVTAMANVSSWCPTPRETAPCLLKILPGRYVLDATTGSTLSAAQYIDIEGSGQGNTVLVGGGGPTYGPLLMGAGSEVRNLTLEFVSTQAGAAVNGHGGTLRDVTVRFSGTNPGTTTSIGINVTGGGKMLLKGVTVDASGPGASFIGVAVSGSEATLVDCDVKVATTAPSGTGGGGVFAVSSSFGTTRILGSRLSATGAGTFVAALYVSKGSTQVASSQLTAVAGWAAYSAFDQSQLRAGTLRIDASQLSAQGVGGVLKVERDTETYVAASRLDGVLPAPWGTPKALSCVVSYDGTNQPVPAGCYQ